MIGAHMTENHISFRMVVNVVRFNITIFLISKEISRFKPTNFQKWQFLTGLNQ